MSRAEEIPLAYCNRLPVIEVSVTEKAKLRFLVDTAATSILNSKSFPEGDPGKVSVTSWSGTTQAKSRQVTLHQLTIGHHILQDLRLPAVDLSAIGLNCGKRIDGILGIDLLAQLGMTVDLKNHKAQIQPDDRNTQAVISELHQSLTDCVEALNRADEAALAECLDPRIVTYTSEGDVYGRIATLDYYRKTFFQRNPPAQLSMVPRADHLIGDAVWVEYDLKIVFPQQVIAVGGTALCRKRDGKWRIVHMIHSSPPAPGHAAQPEDAQTRGSHAP